MKHEQLRAAVLSVMGQTSDVFSVNGRERWLIRRLINTVAH